MSPQPSAQAWTGAPRPDDTPVQMSPNHAKDAEPAWHAGDDDLLPAAAFAKLPPDLYRRSPLDPVTADNVGVAASSGAALSAPMATQLPSAADLLSPEPLAADAVWPKWRDVDPAATEPAPDAVTPPTPEPPQPVSSAVGGNGEVEDWRSRGQLSYPFPNARPDPQAIY